MTRSEEATAWFHAVYEAVQEIPYGRVTTYAHIARLLGRPQCPRQVGVCLKHLPSEAADTDQHTANVPWQRVINSKGAISPRGVSGASRQAAALRSEGVEVGRGNMGEFIVDMVQYGWFPDVLPSEAAREAVESNADG